MENWQNPLFITLVLTGISFMIIRMIISKFPPKKINKFYGYRTKSSMKSQERWDFAQEFSNDLMLKYGILLTLIGIGGYFISMSEVVSVFISIAVILILVFTMFYQTEKAIKEKFGDN